MLRQVSWTRESGGEMRSRPYIVTRRQTADSGRSNEVLTRGSACVACGLCRISFFSMLPAAGHVSPLLPKMCD